MIEICHVTAGYLPDENILQDVSFTAPQGQITTLIGPNGCGKTTLLRAAARQLPLRGGEIRIEGRPIGAYSRKAFAQLAAFLPQVRSVPAITVRSLVAHGRFPYLGFSRQLRAADKAAVREAMEITGVAPWADRDLRALSGGERQRVYIAMALAQDTKVIFLDEPTTYLDLRHQFELLELLELLKQRGKTILFVLHDLAHALRYSDRIVLMEGGKLAGQGTPAQILESGMLDAVFGICTHAAPDGYWFTPQHGDTGRF